MQNSILLQSIKDAKNYFKSHIEQVPSDSPYVFPKDAMPPMEGSFYGQDQTLYVWNWISESSKLHVQVLNVGMPSLVFFI